MSDRVAPAVVDDDLRRRIEARQARQQALGANPPEPGQARPQRSRRARANQGQRWMRWLHVYTSMIALLVILFFGVTGLLLNHPSWLGGDEVTTTDISGTLPATVVAEDGRIEFLAVSEYLRSEHGIVGEVTNFDQVSTEGSINYTGPSYGASVRFDVTTLAFDVAVREEGFVNAMRDLHSGSDTGSAWDLAIDVAAVFLVVVAISGFGIQLLMAKRRRRAMAWFAAGSVVTVFLIWFTIV